MSLLDSLRGAFATRQRTAQQAYSDLVKSTVDGRDVSPAKAEAILAAAGKSVPDFERDVKAREQRMADQRELRSLLAEAEKRPGLERKLAEAQAVLNEARAKFEEAAAPLKSQIDAISFSRYRIEQLQQQLATDSQPESELRQESAALSGGPLADAVRLGHIGAIHKLRLQISDINGRADQIRRESALKTDAAVAA